MASLDDSCASCTYFTDSGYCERKGRNAKGSDYKCDSYCEAYSRSRSEKENLLEQKNGFANLQRVIVKGFETEF